MKLKTKLIISSCSLAFIGLVEIFSSFKETSTNVVLNQLKTAGATDLTTSSINLFSYVLWTIYFILVLCNFYIWSKKEVPVAKTVVNQFDFTKIQEKEMNND